MKPEHRFFEEIRRTAESYRAGAELRTAQMRLGNVTLKAKVLDADRLGCVLESLELHADAVPEDLRDWSTRVGEALKVWGEPLQVVEVESGEGRVLLRSIPSKETDEPEYFEALVRSRPALHLHLKRCRLTGSHLRPAPQSFTLTKDAFAKGIQRLLELASHLLHA